jgi:hypothetical protein
VNRNETQVALAGLLLEKIRQDRYPSATEMMLLEEILPPRLLPGYVEVLLDKVAEDDRPSIPMIRRIQRLIDAMP